MSVALHATSDVLHKMMVVYPDRRLLEMQKYNTKNKIIPYYKTALTMLYIIQAYTLFKGYRY